MFQNHTLNQVTRVFSFIFIFVAIMFLVAYCWPQPAEANDNDREAEIGKMYQKHLDEVREYIDHFHRNTGKGMRKKVENAKKRIAPVVVEHSLNNEVDPLLTSVIISLESSWRPGREGDLEEVGLMQVMDPPVQPKNYVDEVIIGTRRLKMAVDECKDVYGALTHYGSGVCKPRTKITAKKMHYRLDLYEEAVKLTRGK